MQIRDRLHGRKDVEIISIPADKRKDEAARKALLNSVDIAILCLPDEAAKEAVHLIDKGSKTRVIDASSAFRVNPAVAHGFAELSTSQRSIIAGAAWSPIPGCYPQGLIALVKPLINAGILPADYPATYNAVSGYTGGGKKMIADYEAAGVSANPYWPYGLTFNHKHLAEMRAYSGLAGDVIFQPAVGNYAQGMMGCVPLFNDAMAKGANAAACHAALAAAYEGSRFITVAPLNDMEQAPGLSPQAMNNTNRMALHVFANAERGQMLLMAIYDNLGKGASGAAVQNLNLMIGADEAMSVDLMVTR